MRTESGQQGPRRDLSGSKVSALITQHSLLVLALGAVLFALCVSAEAQQAQKVLRIGYFSGTDRATDSPRAEGIRRALRELGYIEGQNVAIEYRHVEGRGRQPQLAAELVRLKVDVIVVAGGDNVIREAMNATKTTPIVLTGPGSDPVEAGFVKSLARPGGNVTGVTLLSRELGGKRLELFKEVVPKVTRIAVLYEPTVPGTKREVKEDLPIAARALQLSVQPWEVGSADGFERAFGALSKDRPGGLYVPGGGSFIRANLKRIAGFALKSRLPSLYTYEEAVDAGGLMYYSAVEEDSYGRVAYYVDKILKGTKPADLPVEQPTKFALIINLKTAKQIGVTIPQRVLGRADKVIK